MYICTSGRIFLRPSRYRCTEKSTLSRSPMRIGELQSDALRVRIVLLENLSVEGRPITARVLVSTPPVFDMRSARNVRYARLASDRRQMRSSACRLALDRSPVVARPGESRVRLLQMMNQVMVSWHSSFLLRKGVQRPHRGNTPRPVQRERPVSHLLQGLQEMACALIGGANELS